MARALVLGSQNDFPSHPALYKHSTRLVNVRLVLYQIILPQSLSLPAPLRCRACTDDFPTESATRSTTGSRTSLERVDGGFLVVLSVSEDLVPAANVVVALLIGIAATSTPAFARGVSTSKDVLPLLPNTCFMRCLQASSTPAYCAARKVFGKLPVLF
jgi:hypothetical protein